MKSTHHFRLSLLVAGAFCAGCAADLRLPAEPAETPSTVTVAADIAATPDVGMEPKSTTVDEGISNVNVSVPMPDLNIDELDCRREIKTGSHRERERCMTRSQRRAIRQASQEWLRSGGWQGSPVVVR